VRRSDALRALALAPALGSAWIAPARAQTLATIRYLSSPSDDQLPVLYAQKNNLFQAAGIELVAQRAQSGAAVAQAVVGGAIDIGKGSLMSLIAAHARGIPFELIAPAAIHREGSSTNSAVIVAVDSPIRSVADLPGKVVSSTAVGDIGYLGVRALVDAAGGDSSAVRWVELPTSAVAAAIEAGRVEAGITVEPYMSKLLAGGKVRVLVDPLNGYRRQILEGAYFAMHDYIGAHRDAVARFARVLQQAATYTNAHLAETLPLFIAYSGMDPETVMKMHHAEIATTFDAADIQPIVDTAAKYKTIPQRFDARELIAR